MYQGTITRTPIQPVPELKTKDLDRLQELAKHNDPLVSKQAELILKWIREAGL